MSAWSELERTALLGTRRETPSIPEISPALDELLGALHEGEAEHALLCIAGALDLYEQIGRLPARLKPEAPQPLPGEDRPPPPPLVARYLSRMIEGPLRPLLEEYLIELHKAGLRLPDTLLPNILASGYRKSKMRTAILPVLGHRGRWLAANHPHWRYAAVDPASWSSLRNAWEQTPARQRPNLIGQLRAVAPEQGRALVESTWRGENDQMRLTLIRQLATGLSMGDEPLLETALDDRNHLVRRQASTLLAHLPQSRLCRRMINYIPRYLTWTPERTRKITISLPEVTPAMRRDGIIGSKSTIAARVRSQEIIQLVGAVPLEAWQSAWGIEPRGMVQAISTTSWPRTLTTGLSHAAQRQENAQWAWILIDEAGVIPSTARLLPVLAPDDVHKLALRALSDITAGELTRDSTLIAIMRRWSGSWNRDMSARITAVFARHCRITATERSPNHIVREALMKFSRQADPDLADEARTMLGDPADLGCWRNTGTEFLHTLRFRRDMLAALNTDK